jgi:hypothetical protein
MHGFLRLLCHDIPFRWDEHAQTTFDDLKVVLSNAPLISPPDYDRDYILYLSASTVSVAGVLIQLGDDGHEHVIYYISKNISGPPLKYNHEEKLPSQLSSQSRNCVIISCFALPKSWQIPTPCSTFLVDDKLMENFLDGSSSFRNTT